MSIYIPLGRSRVLKLAFSFEAKVSLVARCTECPYVVHTSGMSSKAAIKVRHQESAAGFMPNHSVVWFDV